MQYDVLICINREERVAFSLLKQAYVPSYGGVFHVLYTHTHWDAVRCEKCKSNTSKPYWRGNRGKQKLIPAPRKGVTYGNTAI